MSKTQLRIGIDVDDVLVRSGEKIVELYNSLYGTSLTIENWYSYDDMTPWGHEDFRVAYERVTQIMLSDRFLSAEAVDGAKEALELFKQRDDFIVAITGRPSIMHDMTVRQLEKLFPGFFTDDTVYHTDHYVEDKRRAKRDIALNLGLTHFVDDQIEHLKMMAGDQIDVMLFCADYHWTKDAFYEGVRRVRGWQEIVDGLE